jgi:hypothetical protein
MSQYICKFSNKCPVNGGGAGTCEHSRLHEKVGTCSFNCWGSCPHASCMAVEDICFDDGVEVRCSESNYCGGMCTHKSPHKKGSFCVLEKCGTVGRNVCCVPVGLIDKKVSLLPTPVPTRLKWVCEPKGGPSEAGFEVEGVGLIDSLKKALDSLGWKLVRRTNEV